MGLVGLVLTSSLLKRSPGDGVVGGSRGQATDSEEGKSGDGAPNKGKTSRGLLSGLAKGFRDIGGANGSIVVAKSFDGEVVTAFGLCFCLGVTGVALGAFSSSVSSAISSIRSILCGLSLELLFSPASGP